MIRFSLFTSALVMHSTIHALDTNSTTEANKSTLVFEGRNHTSTMASTLDDEHGRNEPASLLIIGVATIVGGIIVAFSLAALCYFLRARKKRCDSLKVSMAASPEKCNVTRDKWEIDRGDLTILYECRIGSGAFTNVYKCHLKQRTDAVAIKLAKDNCADARKDIEREVKLMKTVGTHPHVLSLVGYSDLYGGRLAILLELCSNGDLHTWLRQHPVRLCRTEEEIDRCEQHEASSAMHRQQLSIAWQVADGLVYLASRKIVHRDIAARLILLTESMEAKISDFVLPQGSEGNVLISKCGEIPVKWMSPESLRVGTFTTKTDMWNYGMLLFELYTGGTCPFSHVHPLDQLATLDGGERPPKPDRCPDKVYALMQRCWKMKPDHRPTVEEAKKELASVTEADYDRFKLCLDDRKGLEDVQL